MKKITIVLALLFVMVGSSLGWDETISGKISMVEVTNGENLGFRVHINGKFGGYLNESDSNYKAYLATLLSAMQGKNSVTLYTNKRNISGGTYNHIEHVNVAAN